MALVVALAAPRRVAAGAQATRPRLRHRRGRRPGRAGPSPLLAAGAGTARGRARSQRRRPPTATWRTWRCSRTGATWSCAATPSTWTRARCASSPTPRGASTPAAVAGRPEPAGEPLAVATGGAAPWICPSTSRSTARARAPRLRPRRRQPHLRPARRGAASGPAGLPLRSPAPGRVLREPRPLPRGRHLRAPSRRPRGVRLARRAGSRADQSQHVPGRPLPDRRDRRPLRCDRDPRRRRGRLAGRQLRRDRRRPRARASRMDARAPWPSGSARRRRWTSWRWRGASTARTPTSSSSSSSTRRGRSTPLPGTLAFELNVKNEILGIGLGRGPRRRLRKRRRPAQRRLHGRDRPLPARWTASRSSATRWATAGWRTLCSSGRAGAANGSLLGRGGVHWSFFADTDASVLEGNDIEDRGGGRFETVAIARGYSRSRPVRDGLPRGGRSAAVLLRRGPRRLPAQPRLQGHPGPEPGVTFTGVRRDVRIEEVVAALGPRDPLREARPRLLRQAFILVADAMAPATPETPPRPRAHPLALRALVPRGNRRAGRGWIRPCPDDGRVTFRLERGTLDTRRAEHRAAN